MGERPFNSTASATPHSEFLCFNGSLTLNTENAGQWTDSLRPATENGAYQVPFTLRAAASSTASQPITGCWDVWFGEGSAQQEGVASAQLDLRFSDGRTEGTMRTPTGDYRYLSGQFDGNELNLQTFDGAHLFYFSATRSMMRGVMVISTAATTTTPRGQQPLLNRGIPVSRWTN